MFLLVAGFIAGVVYFVEVKQNKDKGEYKPEEEDKAPVPPEQPKQ